MINNKKAQMFTFFGIMISVMIWITFAQLLGPVKDEITTARSVGELDCANTSISVGTKATCVVTDWTLFGWAGAIITVVIGAAAGGLLDTFLKKKE